MGSGQKETSVLTTVAGLRRETPTTRPTDWRSAGSDNTRWRTGQAVGLL